MQGLVQHSWGDGINTLCLMSALVPYARSYKDCRNAGWPTWLISVCVCLYDAETDGADHSRKPATPDALTFADNITDALDRPIDIDAIAMEFMRSIAPLYGLTDESAIKSAARKWMKASETASETTAAYDAAEGMWPNSPLGPDILTPIAQKIWQSNFPPPDIRERQPTPDTPYADVERLRSALIRAVRLAAHQ